jgi:hypothetical protein
MKLKFFIILIVLSLAAPEAFAEFYKYIDPEGNILFTDDLSEVPANQRPGVKEYTEPEKKTGQPDKIEKAEEIVENEPVAIESNEDEPDFDKRKKMLEQEYILLKKENTALAGTRKKLKTKAQIVEYNEQALLIKNKIENYKQNKAELNAEIDAYNKSLQHNPEKK